MAIKYPPYYEVDANGNVPVSGISTGNVASGATDSGNPVKVGGKYNATPPTLTDGQRGDLQQDANGNLKVTQATALANTTDSITSYQATDALMNGTTALTPKYAKIALSATGTVVAAVTSKKIRVLGMALVSSGTVNANLQSHTTTATASGLFYTVADSGAVLPFSPVGWFETVAGEALDLALSGSVAVGGQVVYVEV